jgi:ribosomal protein L37E
MRLLPRLFDVSSGAATNERMHRECRSCGRNVEDETTECPTCGGGIAAYAL